MIRRSMDRGLERSRRRPPPLINPLRKRPLQQILPEEVYRRCDAGVKGEAGELERVEVEGCLLGCGG